MELDLQHPSTLSDEELQAEVTFFSNLTGFLSTDEQPICHARDHLARIAANRWRACAVQQERRAERVP